MDYKLICCDLDGTLLNSQGHVSEENAQAIRRLTEKGVVFAPSSGRCLAEMPKEVTELPFVRYVIHSDGAVIYDKKEKKRHTACMDRQTANLLFDVLADYDTLPSTRIEGQSYQDAAQASMAQYAYYRCSPYYAEFLYNMVPKKENFSAFCRSAKETEMVCAFFRSQEELEDCKARLLSLGCFDVASSEHSNLEIFHKSAGKGNALLRLAALLGIPQEETVCLGDTVNDLTQIRAAGLGLAMANALPQVKDAADGVVCSNDEHAIVYLEKHYF